MELEDIQGLQAMKPADVFAGGRAHTGAGIAKDTTPHCASWALATPSFSLTDWEVIFDQAIVGHETLNAAELLIETREPSFI